MFDHDERPVAGAPRRRYENPASSHAVGSSPPNGSINTLLFMAALIFTGSIWENSDHGVITIKASAPRQASRAEPANRNRGYVIGSTWTCGSYATLANGARASMTASAGEFFVECV